MIFCHITFCIVLGLLLAETGSSPTVDSNLIADKNRYLLAGLEKLKDEMSNGDWPSTPNMLMLSPEELRFLEYRNVLEKARQSYCATFWPEYLSKQENTSQNKMKKNSEMSRGVYNALNHYDMFNAGK